MSRTEWTIRTAWTARLVAAGAGPADLVVAHAIRRLVFKGRSSARVSRQELADHTALSLKSIDRSLSRMAAAGALEREQSVRSDGRRGDNDLTPVWEFDVERARPAFDAPRRGAHPPSAYVAHDATSHREPLPRKEEPQPRATPAQDSGVTASHPRASTASHHGGSPLPLPDPPPEKTHTNTPEYPQSRRPLPPDPRALPASVIALPAKPGETREPTPDDLRFLAELAARRERMLSKPPASPANAR